MASHSDSKARQAAGGYPDSPLPLSGDHIRLLTIEPADNWDDPLICGLEQFKLDGNVPAYAALSYTWGQAGRTEYEISCMGQSMLINGSLNSALRAIRLPNLSRRIWCDQICICQVDNAEKNHQIPLMHGIYGQFARQVFAYITEFDPAAFGAESIPVFFQYARWVLRAPFIEGDTVPEQERVLNFNSRKDLDEGREALIDFLKRPWFRRSWIVQEAAAKPFDLFLYVGPHRFLYADLSEVVQWTNEDMTKELRVSSLGLRHPAGKVTYLNALRFCAAINSVAFEERELQDLVQTFSAWEATDPRDKIWAFQALAKDSDRYQSADYAKSVNEVFRQFAAAVLRQGLSHVLSLITFAVLDCRLYGDLPSWVVDWERLQLSLRARKPAPLRNNYVFSAGAALTNESDYHFDGSVLVLPGLVLAQITEVSTACMFEDWSVWNLGYLTLAERLISRHPQVQDEASTRRLTGAQKRPRQVLAELLVVNGESSLSTLDGNEEAYLDTLESRCQFVIEQFRDERYKRSSSSHVFIPLFAEGRQPKQSRLGWWSRMGVNPAALSHEISHANDPDVSADDTLDLQRKNDSRRADNTVFAALSEGLDRTDTSAQSSIQAGTKRKVDETDIVERFCGSDDDDPSGRRELTAEESRIHRLYQGIGVDPRDGHPYEQAQDSRGNFYIARHTEGDGPPELIEGDDFDSVEEQERERAYLQYRDTVLALNEDNKIFALDDGTIAIAREVEKGDMIAVFRGARMPFVLRPQPGREDEEGENKKKTTTYRLVSEAFVPGIMFDGKAFEGREDEIGDITIV